MSDTLLTGEYFKLTPDWFEEEIRQLINQQRVASTSTRASDSEIERWSKHLYNRLSLIQVEDMRRSITTWVDRYASQQGAWPKMSTREDIESLAMFLTGGSDG